ncbi:MAG: hypothetical protein WBF90_33700 [Rivularia sp. (in: cyanobacteria)]
MAIRILRGVGNQPILLSTKTRLLDEKQIAVIKSDKQDCGVRYFNCYLVSTGNIWERFIDSIKYKLLRKDVRQIYIRKLKTNVEKNK